MHPGHSEPPTIDSTSRRTNGATRRRLGRGLRAHAGAARPACARRHWPPRSAAPWSTTTSRIYGTASALIFGELFFPAFGVSQALILSFATYAVGLPRPPDRRSVLRGDGRQARTQVGADHHDPAHGPVLPVRRACCRRRRPSGSGRRSCWSCLRLAQGFGAGAEQAGATVLMAEYSPPPKRGFLSALPFVGHPGRHPAGRRGVGVPGYRSPTRCCSAGCGGCRSWPRCC